MKNNAARWMKYLHDVENLENKINHDLYFGDFDDDDRITLMSIISSLDHIADRIERNYIHAFYK